jgi:L-iditol 2-dehydrogenase
MLHSTNFYPGGFAQYLRVPEINVDRGTFLLPVKMSYDEGTFIEPLACVIRGFRVAGFKPGVSVLVLGSGVAGLLNIKLAKALGASKIFATDIDDYKLKIAKKMGADFVINAKENIPELIKKNNKNELIDFVIPCVGVPSAIRQGIESVALGGTILFFAPTKLGIDVAFPLFDIWNKQVKMFSTYAGAPQDLKEAIDLIKSRKVTVTDMITHKFPLEKAGQAFKLAAQSKKSIKIIIEPNK